MIKVFKIKYLTFFFIFLLFNNTKIFSQNTRILSDSSEISILTCSPGPELYAAFGHSAFRIKDLKNNLDWVFNYGTFNFKTPNFYLKFIKGQLNYELTIEPYYYFEKSYTADNRDVYQQVLNLDSLQKQKLFDFLIWNASDENKEYLYDFFWDNCATRIRDVINKQFADTIIFPEKEWKVSYRDLIDSYLEPSYWTHFGINLVLGMPADSLVDYFSVQFLPDYMDTTFSAVKYKDANLGNFVVKREHIIKSLPKDDQNLYKYISPKVVFWFLFILISLITFLEFKRKKKYFLTDIILLLFLGIIGLIITFMWFGTIHKAANYNLNFIWALPTHFVVAFIFMKTKKSKILNYYLLISGILAIILIPLWNIFPQRFDTALIPLFLIIGLRFITLFLYNKKLKQK